MKNILVATLMFGATVASAEMCDELWYTKNLLFDRAGHCFSSALGRANFDNADCIGANPTLTADEQRQYNYVLEMEADWQCGVDNSLYREIDIQQQDLRRDMIILPVRDGFESGCVGYSGDPLPLRRGPARTADMTGEIRAGMSFAILYAYEGDWSFINLEGDAGAGWGRLGQTRFTEFCEMFAG